MSTVIYEKTDHIAYVRLNRPEALNAINNEMRRELEAVWHDFNADDDLWVAILTAEGDRAFSSGADLRERAYVTGEKEDPRPIHTLGHGINVYKPIVCGIHGYCLAAGLDVALACDIRVAADDASIGMTMTRWGVMAATGATQLAPYHRLDQGYGDAADGGAHHRSGGVGHRACQQGSAQGAAYGDL